MNKKISLFTFLILFYSFSFAQIVKVEPSNWWVGMNNPTLEIMIHGVNISNYKVSFQYEGVSLNKITQTENPNYLFININIAASTKPGTLSLNFLSGKKSIAYQFPLLARERNPESLKGFSASDLVYLIMPDRFSNGDPSNDNNASMNEKTINRSEMYARHGGDLQGIINHLDYLKDLGATAIWSCPMTTNDQPKASYHGYAVTDLYKIDPRMGTNELYKQYVITAHNKNLKVIMDFVYNHVGNECYWIKDLPSKDWVHQFPEFTRSNYRPNALIDPYSSEIDKMLCSDGWFDYHMPDLNQKNDQLATYLIQNTIWWVEYAGIDAYRFDTYPYPDNAFMCKAFKALKDEYPTIGIVGETWEQSLPSIAYWQENSPIRKDGLNSSMPSLTDFMLYFAIKDGLKEGFGWNTGLSRIYYTLSQDHLYSDAYKNLTFLDNHDIGRIYSEIGKDFNKWKMAVTMLMTLRGIPSIYYGTEILMDGFSNPDGLVRKDFMGGWKEDSINKFTASGRNSLENESFNFIKTLANWRAKSVAVTEGKLMQFVPQDETYVYFRYTDSKCVIVLFNTSSTEKTLDGKRFLERTKNYTSAKDVLSNKLLDNLNSFTIPANGVMVLDLQ